MKTCKKGHTFLTQKRCPTCRREEYRLWNAKRWNDGLTPTERLKRARRKWN